MSRAEENTKMADNSSKPTYKTYEQLAHEAAEKI